MKDSWQDLGTFTKGDQGRYIYFVFTEKKFNPTEKRFEISDLNPADYTAIKFCARTEQNNQDMDDHSKDDIYENLTSDGGGVYHYEWGSTDLSKIGRWNVRIEFEKTGGKKFHHPEVFYFHVERKMPGNYGDFG